MTASGFPDFDLLKSPLEGTNLIEASAGTGKTYAIAGIFLRLLLEKGLTVGRILVVTYTVAATEALKERIRETLRKAVAAFEKGRSDDAFLERVVKANPQKEKALRLLRSALRDFDEAPIFTIHGFCRRTLHDNAFESMSLFDTELINDETALREEVARDFWRLHFYNAPVEFVAYALEKGCSPDYYLNLSKKKAPNPDMKIFPEAEPVELAALDPFLDTARKAKVSWPSVKVEVVERLKDPGLNKTKYREGGASLIAAMDLYTGARSAFPLFAGIEKLTPKGLKEGVKTGKTPPAHPFFNLCGELQERAERLTAEMDGQLLYLKAEIFRYIERELTTRKERLNIRSFDDLLTRTRDALNGQNGLALVGALRKRYRAALIDEFQDTDPVQYAIFQCIFEKSDGILFLIGDPKQAIYGFRGADLFTYLKASKNVSSRYTLTSNWRSEPGLIQAVNTVFSRRRNPFLYDDILFEDAVAGNADERPTLTLSGRKEPPLRLWYAPKARLEAMSALTNKQNARNVVIAATAAGVVDLLNEGREKRALIGERPVEEGDIAVLVKTNDEARLVQEALRSLGVHSVLHTTGDLFDTDEALEMERLLAGVAEPGSETLVRTALAGAIMGVDGEALEGLGRDESAWERQLSRFRDYNDLWESRGFIRMFRRLLAQEGVRARLLSLPDGERRLTNILHLSEVLHEAATEGRLGTAGLIKWLSRRRADKSPAPEEHQLRLESDARAVRIVTVHKSKGLEYPVVFCPFHWEGSAIKDEEFVYHDGDDGWRATLVIGPAEPEKKKAAWREALAESVRLLYVSLTRAKHGCYVAWGPFKDAAASSLSYILHPAETAGTDAVEKAERCFENLSDDGIMRDLEDLVRRSDGTITLSDMPEGDAADYIRPAVGPPELSFRPFSGGIRKDWGVASFSRLVAEQGTATKVAPEEPDHDAAFPEGGEPLDEEPSGIFAFPRGARAGTFLHSLFEDLSFTAGKKDVECLVLAKLRGFGYDPGWKETLCDMVDRVLDAPLSTEGECLHLRGVTDGMRLNELEFYFPLRPLSPEKLKDLFARPGKINLPPEFPERIGSLRFQPCRGFMKGYMDLVFRWNGRFYLVDWKSNRLGGRVADYGGEALDRAMTDHFYVLQYHLYTLALHRYLTLRVPDYDYGRHFGGVFYIFLRGVSATDGEHGIYRARPEKEFVEAMEDALLDV